MFPPSIVSLLSAAGILVAMNFAPKHSTFDDKEMAAPVNGDSAFDAEKASSDAPKLEVALVDEERYSHTQRGLKSRHVQLIALGGAIGTGLFVGSGESTHPLAVFVRVP